MSITVVREEGEASQHPRYRIPATVEIEDWLYPVQEWSVDGFTLAGVEGAESLKSSIPVKFIFRLDGFAAVVDLNAEIVHRRSRDKVIWCRFSNLTSQKVAVLRAVIDSYLLGEFVSMGELIQVVKRDRADGVDGQGAGQSEEPRGRRALRRLKRWLGLSGLTAVFLALLGFSLWTGYQRIFVVEGRAAVVTANIVVVRAPQPSYFKAMVGPGTDVVARGLPLAYMELVGGGAVTIDSPCECRVLRHLTLSGLFAGTGEPLMTLLPVGESPYVVAKVGVEDAERIVLGDRAKLVLPDGSVLTGKVIRMTAGERLEHERVAPLSGPLTNAISYHEVVVAPQGEIDLEHLGAPSVVRIDTFRGFDPAP